MACVHACKHVHPPNIINQLRIYLFQCYVPQNCSGCGSSDPAIRLKLFLVAKICNLRKKVNEIKKFELDVAVFFIL